jgi:hypothetical protein
VGTPEKKSDIIQADPKIFRLNGSGSGKNNLKSKSIHYTRRKAKAVCMS